MEKIRNNVSIKKRETPKYIIYLLVFLFTLHITPGTYINSSFLEQFVGNDEVGYIYAIASIITIGFFTIIRKVLSIIGNYKTFLIFLIVDFISLFILSLSLNFSGEIWPHIFIISYIFGFISRSICFLNIDIFLEHITKNDETGGVRGFFLTSLNTAFIIGPLITGLMITNIFDVGKVYLISWILLIPVILITIQFLHNFNDSYYKKIDTYDTIIKVYKNSNLRKIFAVNFLLRFFFSWMIIYTPIYLSQFIGFSLGQTTLIISISLIPFILLEIPLGKIADDRWGEKELLTIGFIIMSLTTLFIPFLEIKSFIFWAIILFITRIGASMVEIMNETYLFKKINDDSVNILSLYRAVRPLAYIISPILASLLLILFNIKILFIVLGIVLLTGIKFSLTLQDTK